MKNMKMYESNSSGKDSLKNRMLTAMCEKFSSTVDSSRICWVGTIYEPELPIELMEEIKFSSK